MRLLVYCSHHHTWEDPEILGRPGGGVKWVTEHREDIKSPNGKSPHWESQVTPRVVTEYKTP